MSFQEWLKLEHGKTWGELFCKVNDVKLIEYTIDYEFYCQKRNIEPVWAEERMR